ncbi:BLOC-1-related complex subunit 6 [Drosophila busckii]|uniref:BLOC-1-related complex subunit 6 n=1 Tax=Drosophila busckii TaxID=30019 RepID=UPI00083EBE9D|nr:BLOC-1-related complex subunit 6 [Drosophila busckii]
MSRRSQDIPIRPRYGYTTETEEAAGDIHHNMSHQRGNNRVTPASYSEIPFLAQYPHNVVQDITPTAVKLPPTDSGSESYVNLDSGEEDDDEDPSNSSSKDSSNELNRGKPKSFQSKLPYELDSNTNDATRSTGGMHHFVAYNLEAKLRATTESVASEQATRSSLNAPISRFLQSKNIPQVDGSVLSDIELEAQYLATSVDNLVENLGNLLHSISSITADNVDVHKNAVKKLTDALDANIKCQYQLLAKTEEITKSMRPTEQLAQRIREIKRLVDMLDSTM